MVRLPFDRNARAGRERTSVSRRCVKQHFLSRALIRDHGRPHDVHAAAAIDVHGRTVVRTALQHPPILADAHRWAGHPGRHQCRERDVAKISGVDVPPRKVHRSAGAGDDGRLAAVTHACGQRRGRGRVVDHCRVQIGELRHTGGVAARLSHRTMPMGVFDLRIRRKPPVIEPHDVDVTRGVGPHRVPPAVARRIGARHERRCAECSAGVVGPRPQQHGACGPFGRPDDDRSTAVRRPVEPERCAAAAPR